MKYLWVVWLVVLIALIALPGYVPSERNMTAGQRLFFNASLAWMYGGPVVLILAHLALWIRRRNRQD